MKKVFYFSIILIVVISVFLGIRILNPNNDTDINNTVTEETNQDIVSQEPSENIENAIEENDSVINIGSEIGWYEITKGNLKAVEEDGKWILHPVKLPDSQLLSQDVYKVDNSIIKKLPSKIINTKRDILIQVDNQLYSTAINISNENSEMVKTKDNNLIVGYQDNLWLVDHVTGKMKIFLDMTEFEKTNNYVKSQNKWFLVWGADPYITDDKEKIIFLSNRDNVWNNSYYNSVYVMDTEDNNPRVILSPEKYKSMRVIGVTNNLVVAFSFDNDSIINYNLTDNIEKEIKIGGYTDSLSPDGNYLLFRKNPDGIEREFYLLNLADGTVEYIGMPDDYFYNDNGAWSPDSKKFAFYLNGNSNNLPNKSYRTNVKIAVIDIETKQIDIYDKPSDKSYLYTIGNISWLGNNQVVCYTDDNTTWLLKLE